MKLPTYQALGNSTRTFIVQSAAAERRYAALQAEAVVAGFEFAGDAILVPPLDAQTEAQKSFIKKFLGNL